VKQQQKKVALMILLGGVAAFLVATRLGPMVFGESPAPQTKGKKKEDAASAAKGGGGTKDEGRGSRGGKGHLDPPTRDPRPATPGAAPPPVKASAKPATKGADPEADAPRGSAGASPSLDEVPIDLSAATRLAVRYGPKTARSPFALASFEQDAGLNAPGQPPLKLTGIVRAGTQRLAIIDGRVYTEGDEVWGGLKVSPIEPAAVTLTREGKAKRRLSLEPEVASDQALPRSAEPPSAGMGGD
jgi:hypothetical protein